MFCDNCGTNLPDGTKFCASCGAKIEPQSNSPSVAAQQAPPAYAPAYQPQAAPPQAYAPPQPTTYAGQPHYGGAEPLSVGQYVGTFLLMCVPILNIILLFVWGFGSAANLNKKNFARAILIIFIIMIIVWIFAGAALASALGSMMGGYYY